MKRLNTQEEARELADARALVGTKYSHIADWVYEPCKCNPHLAEPPKCPNCTRKANILNMDQAEKRLDRAAEELREYGYGVTKPR